MLIKGPILAKYGVQTTFYFGMEDGTSSTDAYTGTDVVAADSTLSKDGGASAATTNAVTTTRSPFFSLTLTAAEMQATDILVRINDASAAVFKDVFLWIKTKFQMGQLDIDAGQLTNASAVLIAGVGTGDGIRSTGGATGNGVNFIGGATSGDGMKSSATNGNGNGVNAVGVGTGYGIKNNAADTDHYNNLFAVTEGAEPSAALGTDASLLAIFQHVKRRLFNKSEADGDTLIVYKDDSVTVLSTQSLTDDGTTDTIGRAS